MAEHSGIAGLALAGLFDSAGISHLSSVTAASDLRMASDAAGNLWPTACRLLRLRDTARTDATVIFAVAGAVSRMPSRVRCGPDLAMCAIDQVSGRSEGAL